METKKERKTFEQIKKELEERHKKARAVMSKRFPSLYPPEPIKK
jgi:hypothetical protein